MSESKKRKIDFISPDKQQTIESPHIVVNWTECCLCQKDNNDKLQNSFKSNLRDDKIKDSYRSLTKRMQDFKDEGIMPIPVDFVSLHAGFDTLEESLYHNKACFNKHCKLLFNSQSFEREKCKRDKRLGSQRTNQLSVKLQRLQMLLAVVVIIFYSTHYERDTKL